MKLSTSLVVASVALSQSVAALPAQGYAAQDVAAMRFTSSAKRSNNAVAPRFGQRRSAHRSKRQAPAPTTDPGLLADLLGPLANILQSLGLSANIPAGLPQPAGAAPQEDVANLPIPAIVPNAQNVTSIINGTAPVHPAVLGNVSQPAVPSAAHNVTSNGTAPLHPPVPGNVTDIPANVTGTTHVAPPDLPAEVTALPAMASGLPVPVPVSAPDATIPQIVPVGNAADLLANPAANASLPVTPPVPANATLPVGGNQTSPAPVPANATLPVGGNQTVPAPVPTPSPFPGAVMNDTADDLEDCSSESIELATDMIHPEELPIFTQTVALPSGARPITMTIIEQGNTKSGQKNTAQHTKTVTVTVDDWPYDDEFELPTSVPVAIGGSIAASIIPAIPGVTAPAALPTDATSALPLPAVPTMASVPSVPAGVTAPVPVPSLPAGLSAPSAPNPTDVPPLFEPSVPGDLPAPLSNGLPLPVPVR